MPKLRSVYAGGYDEQKKQKLQSNKLPPKIKCAVCQKIKAVNFFSTIQQLEIRNGIATGQIGDATLEEWVPCVACTPKQVTELVCCICEEVKSLDGFAKAQRRLGENAKCIPCQVMLNGETPVEGKYRHNVIEKLGEEDDGSDSDDSVSNAYESSTFSDTQSNAGVPLTSGSYDPNNEDLSSLDLSDSRENSKPSASHTATSASATATKRVRVPASAGKWQEFSKGNNGKSAQPTSGAKFTGFDRDGNAHQMVRPASTVASDFSDDNTIADPREQAQNAREERDARSRFARIPGGRNVPVYVPSYVGGKTVPDPKAGSDDEDDDDDDWGTI
ncbi:hypothetical protein IMSHALPRED_000268 [Imshaugia aleurites]|uniref:Stc1 domain-containing protein n=1 Tax=Imshaugia aleurites TaxID=172621 RepID=A0A8H3IBH6_9LECA|nr:hypothetical protein IMSHALPRED_000268 [Imshaugia aleurites]